MTGPGPVGPNDNRVRPPSRRSNTARNRTSEEPSVTIAGAAFGDKLRKAADSAGSPEAPTPDPKDPTVASEAGSFGGLPFPEAPIRLPPAPRTNQPVAPVEEGGEANTGEDQPQSRQQKSRAAKRYKPPAESGRNLDEKAT